MKSDVKMVARPKETAALNPSERLIPLATTIQNL